jgi:glycosidase
VELATLLLLTFPGAPSIYYGDEVGLPGRLDPDSRRGFPIEGNWERDVLEYHRKLIAIRHNYPALRTGDYQVLFAEGAVYVFARTLGTEELVIALNIGNEPAQVNVEVAQLQSKPNQMLYGSGEAAWKTEGQLSHLDLKLPARSGCILA